jgi:hypothetical protein
VLHHPALRRRRGWDAQPLSLYDDIGRTYTATRREDPRIAARIHAALGDARTVVNVGAGAGAYEPRDRDVTAVEPSATMRAQRPPGAAPCVDASAEALPFADARFDAAMGILTVHHWADFPAGIAELRRVARDRIVLLHWDQEAWERYWLTAEYFPESAAYERDRWPPIDSLVALLGGPDRVAVEPVPVPHDCRDGFAAAFWRRPHAYLDPAVRAGMSSIAAVEDRLGPAVERLRADLESGAWHERHAGLLQRDELDAGYRLLIARYD